MNRPQFDLYIAVLHFGVMSDADAAMDADLAAAKNKRGVYMKYRHLIPPRAWNHPDPWDVGDSNDPATPWFVGAIALGMCMKERLAAFAAAHRIKDLHG